MTCDKPTFGLLSTAGVLAGEKADPAILLLSHPCVTARSVEDVALVLQALTNAPGGDATSGRHVLQGPLSVRRVGIVTNFAGGYEVKAAFETFIASIATMEIETRQIKAPFDGTSFDVSSVERDRAAINASLFGDIDAIVLPTRTAPAPTVDDARARGHMAVSADNTFFCNYYGLPAISVPSGDKNGLPLGVQFVGPQGGDTHVLALAHAYQRATGWRYLPPPGAQVRLD
ncbi:MAG: amidase family protein [Gammaproteobacteria bacterium]